MKIAVLADDILKEELLSQGLKDIVRVEWVDNVESLIVYPSADAYIDLLFENTQERIELLKKIQQVPVIINSVITTLQLLPPNFVRINGWPTFLKRSIVEASCTDEKIKIEEIFSPFNKKIEWIPDIPGFLTPRVIAAIINEAYFALEEKVSTKDEIDIAMKLGTNYPYGPFEWSKKIDLKNIYTLLSELSKTNNRYLPSSLLTKEAML